MSGSPVHTAFSYSDGKGWPVFPCQWEYGPDRKKPLIADWDVNATTDRHMIDEWWGRWPHALVGVPTGKRSGFVVLDVDRKNGVNGFETLKALGFPSLPETRKSHTPADGVHLHFDPCTNDIRNTCGDRGRGIGKGLDWRGEGGYVIVPTDYSGYAWDLARGLSSAAIPVPEALLPREPRRTAHESGVRNDGLSPYAMGALDSACRAILDAPNGAQEDTLNSECFSIGSLAGAGHVPEHAALRALLGAASKIHSFDARRPWRPTEIELKVRRSFAAGLKKPRGGRGG